MTNTVAKTWVDLDIAGLARASHDPDRYRAVAVIAVVLDLDAKIRP